jgi:hypothetical protein
MKIDNEFPYSDLSADEFEELCVAILSREARGLIVERYGRSGQAQFGVDILGIEPATGEAVAIECKRRGELSIDLLRSITQLFWQNRARWLRVNVHRFIICVAAEIRDSHVSDLWLKEAKRFRRTGITLEIWSARTLTQKISKLPDVRKRFFPRYSDLADLISTAIQAPPHTASVRQSRADLAVLADLNSSQFGSLVKALSDVTNAGERGMLETYLVEAAGAVRFSPNDTRAGIALLRRLLDVPAFYLDWRFRRIIGRIAGEVVSLSTQGSRQRSKVRELAEQCFEHPDTSILLAVAATSGPHAARTLGATVLKRLILQRHPQIRWLIMRGWSLVEPVVTNSFPLPRLLETEDRWLRRRFLLTLSRSLRSGNRSTIKGLIVDHLRDDSSAAGNMRFEAALRRWLSINADVNLSAPTRIDRSKVNMDLSVIINRLKSRRDVNDINHFSAALDYHCIGLDYSSSPEALHIGGAYSEGRYGIIRQWVEEGLASVHKALLFTFVSEILGCADEGVRWAISASMSNWLPKITTIRQKRDLIMKLLNDWHPWVVRESLERLDQNLPNLYGIDPLEILEATSASIERAVEQGWEQQEFLRGYLTVLSKYPDFVEQVKIRRVA